MFGKALPVPLPLRRRPSGGRRVWQEKATGGRRAHLELVLEAHRNLDRRAVALELVADLCCCKTKERVLSATRE